MKKKPLSLAMALTLLGSAYKANGDIACDKDYLIVGVSKLDQSIMNSPAYLNRFEKYKEELKFIANDGKNLTWEVEFVDKKIRRHM
ncbi:MAG TPA: hypothetical protein EYH43_05410 [Persephonella sp.]|nr:hypothetical protein [Persephonella sp.]